MTAPGRGFFDSATDADRRAGWPADRNAGPVVVVGSRAWKAAALPFVAGGLLAAILLAEAILLIDGTLTAAHLTPSQDAVGMTAMVVGLGMAIYVVVVAVRWWRRPSITISRDAVTIYRRRPLAIPWSMITEVASGKRAGSSVLREPGVLLANGRFIRVHALSRLAEPVWQPPGRQAQPIAVPGLPAYLGSRQPGRVRHAAPGSTLQRIQVTLRWHDFRWLFILPLYFGFLVMFPNGNGGAQSGIDVGGAGLVALCFEAVACLIVLSCWVTLTRVVAVGSGWIAWRPRLTRRWRVLALGDVASTIDIQWPRRSGVRLSRTDGSGLRLRPAELAAGIGPGLALQLAEHPATTAAFLGALQKAPAPADQLAAQAED